METNASSKLSIPTKKGYSFIDPKQIVRCESNGNYTTLYLTGNQKHCICRQLGMLEEILPNDLFLRVHHCHLINLSFLESYDRNGFLCLSGGQLVPVAKRKRREVMDRLRG